MSCFSELPSFVGFLVGWMDGSEVVNWTQDKSLTGRLTEGTEASGCSDPSEPLGSSD